MFFRGRLRRGFSSELVEIFESGNGKMGFGIGLGFERSDGRIVVLAKHIYKN